MTIDVSSDRVFQATLGATVGAYAISLDAGTQPADTFIVVVLRLIQGTAGGRALLPASGITWANGYVPGINPAPGAVADIEYTSYDSGVSWTAVVIDIITAWPPGVVTSVGLSAPPEFATGAPVTGVGTLSLTALAQAAGKVWAGPTTGAAAAPGFRALVAADLAAALAAPPAIGTTTPAAAAFTTAAHGIGNANAPSVGVGYTNVGLFAPAASALGFAAGGQVGYVDAAKRWLLATTSVAAQTPIPNTAPRLQILGSDAGTSIFLARYASSPIQNPAIIQGKSSGAVGVHGAVTAGDTLGRNIVVGSDGTDWQNAAELRFTVEGTVAAGIVPGRINFYVTDSGGTQRLRLAVDSAGNLKMGGENIVVDANRALYLPSFTVAGLPTAAAVGAMAYVTDLGGGVGGPVCWDGAFWRRLKETGSQTITANANQTLTVLSQQPVIITGGTWTANRTYTLSTTRAYNGARFRIVHMVAGFTVTIGSKTLSQNQFAEFEYDGTTWNPIGAGSL
ncbi:hypothetical protein D3874_06100 [Oleomonas cavernae]|uniref:DUF2793 domain-containing protein n=1 Tax=Oleomonas cavernae TaxID=2320859 RepID=A0A418W9F2_9PROT|nr:hypothetical protein [Oleomonas cavernae]RJF86645.1 hypothetical protein D3874_06100 [Oleomonas cavernae]